MEQMQIKVAASDENKEMEKNIKLKQDLLTFIGNRWELSTQHLT